jgi:ElaA protein
MELTWTCQSFNELSPSGLYAILQLRIAVFSVEQNCIYQDADGKDPDSFHLCGWDGKHLAAYCRLLPSGLSYDHPSIGRVVTALDYRKGGHGKQLMQHAIVKTMELFNDPIIIISA